jgi:hopanoid-associated phosphorylase
VTILVVCGLKREAKIVERAGFVAIAGGGEMVRREAALEQAITAGGVEAMLSAGIAGALDPALKPGDVVIGTIPSLFSHEVGSLVERLRVLLPEAHLGAITGSDTIAATINQKRDLRAATGALAVDMESHVAARVAERHGVPFAILRTISDGADHVLPPAALVGMNPDGGIAIGAVIASLARHPGQLPELIRTGRCAELAFTALERAFTKLEGQSLTSA